MTGNEFQSLVERKTKKHEIQMLSCDGELKVDENWMSAETSCFRDVARDIRLCHAVRCGR